MIRRPPTQLSLKQSDVQDLSTGRVLAEPEEESDMIPEREPTPNQQQQQQPQHKHGPAMDPMLGGDESMAEDSMLGRAPPATRHRPPQSRHERIMGTGVH